MFRWIVDLLYLENITESITVCRKTRALIDIMSAGICTVFCLFEQRSTFNSGIGFHLTRFGAMATQQILPQLPSTVKFRVLIIGRANAGKTSILQRVCDTTESPVIYRKDRSSTSEQVRLYPRSRFRSHHLARFNSTPQWRLDGFFYSCR